MANSVGPVAIDFVGGHVNERRFRAVLPRRFEQMQRAQRVHFEIEEGNSGGAIMRRLRGGVDDQIGPQFVHQGRTPSRSRMSRASCL